MPRGDGTGPDGTYENCAPTNNSYCRRGRGGQRGFGRDGRYNPRGELRPRYTGKKPKQEQDSGLETSVKPE